jgi:hypothetical protein
MLGSRRADCALGGFRAGGTLRMLCLPWYLRSPGLERARPSCFGSARNVRGSVAAAAPARWCPATLLAAPVPDASLGPALLRTMTSSCLRWCRQRSRCGLLPVGRSVGVHGRSRLATGVHGRSRPAPPPWPARRGTPPRSPPGQRRQPVKHRRQLALGDDVRASISAARLARTHRENEGGATWSRSRSSTCIARSRT